MRQSNEMTIIWLLIYKEMKWTTGFNIGILSGLAFGLLIAPSSGEETRQCLGRQMRFCKRKIDRLCGFGEDALADLKDALKDESVEITDEMRKDLLKFLKRAEREDD